MQPDGRGFRIAVVADELVNSATAGFDVLKVLERAGWGAMVVPPDWYPDDVRAELLVQFAEQIEEFVRHGYQVVCVGNCNTLIEPLANLGVDMPESVIPADGRKLSGFLRRMRAAASGG